MKNDRALFVLSDMLALVLAWQVSEISVQSREITAGAAKACVYINLSYRQPG